jgi:hypothetical protein
MSEEIYTRGVEEVWYDGMQCGEKSNSSRMQSQQR